MDVHLGIGEVKEDGLAAGAAAQKGVNLSQARMSGKKLPLPEHVGRFDELEDTGFLGGDFGLGVELLSAVQALRGFVGLLMKKSGSGMVVIARGRKL